MKRFPLLPSGVAVYSLCSRALPQKNFLAFFLRLRQLYWGTLFGVLIISFLVLLPAVVFSNVLKMECGIYKFGEPIVIKSHTAQILLDQQENSAIFSASFSTTKKVVGRVLSFEENLILIDFTESNIAAYLYHFTQPGCLDNIIDILDNFDRRPRQRTRALEFMKDMYISKGIKINSILQIRLERYNSRLWRYDIKDIFYVLNCM